MIESQPNAAPEPDLGAQFLLAEMENMRRFKEQSDLLSDRRADVLITLTSALGAGLILFYQSLPDKTVILPIVLIATLSVLSVGIITLVQITNAEIYSTQYIRAINSIRAYFARNAPAIKPYLLAPTNSNHPRFGRSSRNRAVGLVINSLLSGITTVTISFLIRPGYPVDVVNIGIFVITLAVTFLVLLSYTNIINRRAERRTQAHGNAEDSLDE